MRRPVVLLFACLLAVLSGCRSGRENRIVIASKNFTEMMLALSVLDLPFKADEHKTEIDGQRFALTAASPLIVFHKEIREASDIGHRREARQHLQVFLVGVIEFAGIGLGNACAHPQVIEDRVVAFPASLARGKLAAERLISVDRHADLRRPNPSRG